MSEQVFTGSISYCTKKCREMQKRGWKIASFRNIYGGKQVYKMIYVGMEMVNGRWVTK